MFSTFVPIKKDQTGSSDSMFMMAFAGLYHSSHLKSWLKYIGNEPSYDQKKLGVP